MEAALEEESAQRSQPIDFLTDARHGWRKNSRQPDVDSAPRLTLSLPQTDVVCLGAEKKRILSLQTVTHLDDPVVQRHERRLNI